MWASQFGRGPPEWNVAGARFKRDDGNGCPHPLLCTKEAAPNPDDTDQQDPPVMMSSHACWELTRVQVQATKSIQHYPKAHFSFWCWKKAASPCRLFDKGWLPQTQPGPDAKYVAKGRMLMPTLWRDCFSSLSGRFLRWRESRRNFSFFTQPKHIWASVEKIRRLLTLFPSPSLCLTLSLSLWLSRTTFGSWLFPAFLPSFISSLQSKPDLSSKQKFAMWKNPHVLYLFIYLSLSLSIYFVLKKQGWPIAREISCHSSQ